jgi:hypothetical protein
MSHLPRMPVRFVDSNAELLTGQDLSKAVSGGTANESLTDWKRLNENEMDMGPEMPCIEPTYRTPADRVNGNEMFRRMPNGDLDVEYAKHKVVDALHKVKDKGNVTNMEKLALSILFPEVIMTVDPRLLEPIARVQMRLAPWELDLVRRAAAKHLQEEMQYNAGLGGFPTPHRQA